MQNKGTQQDGILQGVPVKGLVESTVSDSIENKTILLVSGIFGQSWLRRLCHNRRILNPKLLPKSTAITVWVYVWRWHPTWKPLPPVYELSECDKSCKALQGVSGLERYYINATAFVICFRNVGFLPEDENHSHFSGTILCSCWTLMSLVVSLLFSTFQALNLNG